MRITVSLIVNLVAHGKQTAEILEEYPDLQQDDIQQALEYSLKLATDVVTDVADEAASVTSATKSAAN